MIFDRTVLLASEGGIKLKYGFRVGKWYYAKGTEVKLVPATDERVQQIFPGIAEVEASQYVAIQLPQRSDPTIVSVKELEL